MRRQILPETKEMAQVGHEEMKLHILAVPHQQEGHVNGVLKLAQALASQQGVLVTFAYPARFHALARKRGKLPDPTSMSLRVEVVDDGLPPEEEQPFTLELLRDSIPIFRNSVGVLLDSLLHSSNLPPLCCIVSDTFVPWTQDLATAAALPRVDFWTSPAAVYSMGSQLACLISNGILPLPDSAWLDADKKWTVEAPLIEGIPGLPPIPPTDLPSICLKQGLYLEFMATAFGCIKEAHTILVNSMYELESEVFDALQANGFPILAIGPLLGPPCETLSPSTSMDKCIQWLHTQHPLSVIYIALGSMATFTLGEAHALAHALESFGRPFLWVVRQDSLFGSLADTLPHGFLQRTVEKGLGQIVSWAPQTKVLHHHATGAFFSHCGWNSTLESLWEGVPMVACPRGAEQRFNSRCIVEKWKIGVEVERQQDGSFTKEAVERAFKEVFTLEGKDGTNFKDRALHFKTLAQTTMQKGGASYTNLAHFIQHLHRDN